MEWSIVTTFFALITLVIAALVLVMQDRIAKRLDHYVDHALSNTNSLKTMLSMITQMEAKQDLMFNNSLPAPGETTKVPQSFVDSIDRMLNAKPHYTKDEFGEGIHWENPKLSETISRDTMQMCSFKAASRKALAQFKEKQEAKKAAELLPKRKRGRPMKTPIVKAE